MPSQLFGGPVSSEDLWRFGVLQLLDDYESVRAHGRVDAAARLMADAPAATGHSGLDAAFAGLACWLADRDGWDAPAWARAEERVARPWWFVSSSDYGRAWAMRESPGQLRQALDEARFARVDARVTLVSAGIQELPGTR